MRTPTTMMVMRSSRAIRAMAVFTRLLAIIVMAVCLFSAGVFARGKFTYRTRKSTQPQPGENADDQKP